MIKRSEHALANALKQILL